MTSSLPHLHPDRSRWIRRFVWTRRDSLLPARKPALAHAHIDTHSKHDERNWGKRVKCAAIWLNDMCRWDDGLNPNKSETYANWWGKTLLQYYSDQSSDKYCAFQTCPLENVGKNCVLVFFFFSHLKNTAGGFPESERSSGSYIGENKSTSHRFQERFRRSTKKSKVCRPTFRENHQVCTELKERHPPPSWKRRVLPWSEDSVPSSYPPTRTA